MGLPMSKPFLEKERSEGGEAATALAGERLWERGASIDRRFNGRRHEMVTKTHSDLVDTHDGQKGMADIFGHHI
jgi:hypothetical protein